MAFRVQLHVNLSINHFAKFCLDRASRLALLHPRCRNCRGHGRGIPCTRPRALSRSRSYLPDISMGILLRAMLVYQLLETAQTNHHDQVKYYREFVSHFIRVLRCIADVRTSREKPPPTFPGLRILTDATPGIVTPRLGSGNQTTGTRDLAAACPAGGQLVYIYTDIPRGPIIRNR